MGTIITRKRQDGTIGHTAQIRRKRKGVMVHSEAQTFDRKPAATAWLKKREAELAVPGALERLKVADPPLSDAIDRYTRESLKAIGRTKAQVLQAINRHAIGTKPCSAITSEEIVALARELVTGEGAVMPQTAANYLSHLAAVFRVARPAWGYPLDQQAMTDATVVAGKLGYIGKSQERDRRPTLDEMDRILTHYADRKRRVPQSLPMVPIVVFALFSTRRQSEIVRLARTDVDVPGCRIMVRDMKNPGEKIGNDVLCSLTPEALRVLEAMPPRGASPEVFPYNEDAISTSWTRAMVTLGIENLHFHDLRHDGVSRLFEMGWTIPQVATVSGHRNWTSLKRYSHLRQVGDKYAGWPWLERVMRAKAE